MKILKNVKMTEYSNMKIGGIAKELIIIEDKRDLESISKSRDNIFVIGNGTNTLIGDTYIDKSFVSLKALNKIKKLSETVIQVESGLDFSELIEYTRENNLSGLENLAGIPGSVGGLVHMNGGAYGSEIFDFIREVEVLDSENKIRSIKKENLKYSYRKTEIKEKAYIVISATFELKKGFNKERVEELKAKRENNHPLDLPNLGSTFKNPENNFSAKLIIEAGLQGLKIGDAQISMKHPNFIVNHGEARFDDVMDLIKRVKTEVKKNSGIELSEEIVIVENTNQSKKKDKTI